MAPSILDYEYKPGDELVLHFHMPRMRLLPQEARNHWLESQKEMLLAMRSLLDAAIGMVEEQKAGPARRQEIKVD